ncbi:putative IQ domain-containing protein H [Plasmopara halstedii]
MSVRVDTCCSAKAVGMEKVQQHYHVEDVGRLLLETQEQLRAMREQMTAAAASMEANKSPKRHSSVITNAEVQAFHALLQQTESELRAKAELVLNGIINSSNSVHNSQVQRNTRLPAVSVAAPSPIKHRRGDSRADEFGHINRIDNNSTSMEFFRQQFRNNRVEIRQSLMTSPENWRRKSGARRVRKKTTQHYRLLPCVNKADPSEPTPDLREEDATCGLLNLVTRGFLPAYADLTPAFAGPNGKSNGSGGCALKHRATYIYDRSKRSARCTPLVYSIGFNLAGLKFDFRTSSTPSSAPKPNHSATVSASMPNTKFSSIMQTVSSGPAKRNSLVVAAPRNQNEDIENNCTHSFEDQEDEEGSDDSDIIKDEGFSTKDLAVNVAKIREYNDLVDAYSLHQILIYKGRAMRDTPEFTSFRRVVHDLWGSVEEVLRALEAILFQYFVPLAHVDGQRLIALASTNQPQFSRRELLSCIVNKEQVMSVLRRPGQRYNGRDRKHRAATTIQACARMWMVHHRYVKSRSSNINAIKIQSAFRAYSRCTALKARLREIRCEKAAKWEARMYEFKSQWSQIAARRRIVVHVPSMSLGEHSRLNAENFAVQQNLQLTRICAAALDLQVDLLVYVSPYELTADVSQYFHKLLQLSGPADSRPRVKFVYPEQAARFPAHFSLSSLILYSPYCLRRIRHYTAGNEAYLVMGLPGPEDQRLAITLDLPILGALPSQALPLLTRSGGKRLLIQADINVPTGTYELYDEHEISVALAKLAVAHIDQSKWLIKLDYDPLGVGEAVVDLSSMQAMRELHREKRTPEYWRQPGTRDAAANLFLTEFERPGKLARLTTPIHTELYPTWREYAAAIGHFGCVIEAVPPTASAASMEEPTYLRANIFVDPNGTVHMTSTQNVLTTTRGGLSRKSEIFAFPQTVAPHAAIKGACNAVGKQLAETNVWGYVSLDFVVFQDIKSNAAVRLWALAIHPFLTNSAATFACFHLLTRGCLDANSGIYRVPGTKKLQTACTAEQSGNHDAMDLLLREASLTKAIFQGATRCYVVCSYVFHPNVTATQYTTFFQNCRLHGVCFDVSRALGTLFLLADSLTAGVFGILSIGETAQDALSYLRTALEVIGREAGATKGIVSSSSRSVLGNFADVLSTVRASTGGGSSNRLGQVHRMLKL